MEVERLLTVEEMVPWHRLPQTVLALAEKIAAPAYDIRQALAGVYTSAPIGVWYHHEKQSTLLEVPDSATAQDTALVRSAVARVADLPEAFILGQFAPSNDLVKVAFSPSLRYTSEALNFFPGHYPGGMPNNAGPAASMLTSGLVGAGLGYGAGWLGEKLLPQKWERGKLRRTLAVLGGAAGIVPGAVLGMINKHNGLPFNSANAVGGMPLDKPAGVEPGEKAGWDAGVTLGTQYTQAAVNYAGTWAKRAADAVKDAFDTLGDEPAPRHHGPLEVNVNALGQTLWETGASPQTAGMTMGTLAAAQQMPGGERSGFVTPMQMGNLALHMGAGWLSGALVGSALGVLTGMPEATQDKLKQTGAYLGIVQAVVPRLFGL